jgi:ATP adenylyltransferase
MENLHAPWRIEYILAPKKPEDADVFVNIAQSSDDVENLVIFRDRTCYAVLNRYPYTAATCWLFPTKKFLISTV